VAEWCIAAVSLVILAPLLAALGLFVKLHSPGPAFYSQIRLGRSGRLFRIYKFRTMTHNCEAKTGAVWAQQNDPRITPLGRLLRDTHLDELPQLWNVVRGEMSLIGPRPERPELAMKIERVIPGFSARLQVRPGLTGLAQMRLPPDREMEDVAHKLEQDLIYIEKLSFLMDARILACTVLVMLEAGCRSTSRALLGDYRAEKSETAMPEPTVSADAEQTDVSDESQSSESEPALLAA
jgi:lipopolysaccharide/colanic/teichoic acid biosynthesis glycosyltransferase